MSQKNLFLTGTQRAGEIFGKLYFTFKGISPDMIQVDQEGVMYPHKLILRKAGFIVFQVLGTTDPAPPGKIKTGAIAFRFAQNNFLRMNHPKTFGIINDQALQFHLFAG